MEDAFTLVVLTLLQLCRAEISNTEWYAANLINDPSYTPKPITEIFTTDLSFTQKLPTVSTLSNTQPTPTDSTTTLAPPATTNLNQDSTTQQNLAQRIPFQIVELPAAQRPQGTSQSLNGNNELSSFILIFDPRKQTSQMFQQPLITSPPPLPVEQPTITETQAPISSTQTSAPTVSTQTTQTSTQETTIVPRNQPPLTIPSVQPVVSTSLIPGRWNVGNVVYPIPNFPLSNTGCNSTNASNLVAVNSTQAPQTIQPGRNRPIITVRLKTPKGSITNIHINPTTTKRPSTTRRRKSNKNDYEVCLNSCHGKKEPICSSPVGIFPINPDRLKGFASLCHMACHNSFKKDQVYEKVADGRCGRLRTRIRPVDKNKLNRDELTKAQYTIHHNAPETVMEFSPLKR